MTSNKFYNEWVTPRPAILLRDVPYLTVQAHSGPGYTYSARAGERVLIVGRMTEDTRDSYGGKWLYSAQINYVHAALVEYGVDFRFMNEGD